MCFGVGDGTRSARTCARRIALRLSWKDLPLGFDVTHRVEVQIEGADGETVFLSAFDARDLDPSGDRPLPGRSPVAEKRLVVQPGSLPALQLPPGDFLLMVAVDALLGIRAPVGPPRLGQARLKLTDAVRESPLSVRVQMGSGPRNTPGSPP